jgi:uncharacterized protein YciI
MTEILMQSTGLWLVTRSHGPRWNDARALEEQAEWKEHAEFMNELERQGFVVLGGPVLDTPDALLVVRAESPAEVNARLAADPWTRSGVLQTTEIRAWELRLGSLPHRNDAR